ncbi:ABC transporter [Rubritalea squalenifaciens DSM 18772]|uniref:ABC transporter n=1 Tax=Rubritalea squalenifaciens DSM 18772 TaxID=1123071 RepID=A0A1M6MBC6_9BACT|nr:ATP-binding cassette domain-containing protein [Rubritalea squalenifaciens]SHJ80737.1 ABC transporter [Rubritalea squalenifaciens DSM 18772]
MLSIESISIESGQFKLKDISFTVESGTCTSLMGPSGSGKTTIMEAICGLRKITSGTILLNNQDITHLRPSERKLSIVPQDNALFPHLTVREHLAFGPSIQKWNQSEIDQRINHLAEGMSISHLLDRYPSNLSGGEAKRVALGRALATRPALLCLDEALTGLDDDTHDEILSLLKDSIQNEGITALHITHSMKEATQLSDKVIKLGDLQPNQAP